MWLREALNALSKEFGAVRVNGPVGYRGNPLEGFFEIAIALF
jgi:hypothetical protein